MKRRYSGHAPNVGMGARTASILASLESAGMHHGRRPERNQQSWDRNPCRHRDRNPCRHRSSYYRTHHYQIQKLFNLFTMMNMEALRLLQMQHRAHQHQHHVQLVHLLHLNVINLTQWLGGIKSGTHTEDLHP